MGCRCSKQVDFGTSGQPNIKTIYRFGRVLGTGAFGQVRECTQRDTNQTYAIKIMVKECHEKGHWSNENMFKREVKILSVLDHPNVVKYYNYFEDNRYSYAVLEYCKGGELFETILKNGAIAEDQAGPLIYQMASAIDYVHSKGVVHRDIKAENFLFQTPDPDSPLKLIDFGMSEQLAQPDLLLTDVCGSPHYLAPELVKRKYSLPADIWALGVLSYLMLFGRYPFDGDNTNAIVKEILNRHLVFEPLEGRAQPSPLAVSFIKHLLQRSVDKRPTATEVLQHPWLLESMGKMSTSKSSPSSSSASTTTSPRRTLNSSSQDFELERRGNDLIVIGNEERRFSKHQQQHEPFWVEVH